MDVLKVEFIIIGWKFKEKCILTHMFMLCQLLGRVHRLHVLPTSLTDYHYWELHNQKTNVKSASHKSIFALLLFVKYLLPTYAGSRTQIKERNLKSHKKYSFI